MKKKKIAILGSGGHAKSCIEVLSGIKNIKIVGLIDDNSKKKLGKYNVICSEKNILKLKKITNNIIIGIGSINDNSKRIRVFNKLKKLGFNFPVIISKYANVSSQSELGEGTIVFNDVFINAGSSIGKNCLINNKTLIEHDVKIKDHCHISTGVIINGNCEVEEGTFIGSGSVILNNLKIKKNSFIKMGTIKKK